jgi:hypothetical protein
MLSAYQNTVEAVGRDYLLKEEDRVDMGSLNQHVWENEDAPVNDSSLKQI